MWQLLKTCSPSYCHTPALGSNRQEPEMGMVTGVPLPHEFKSPVKLKSHPPHLHSLKTQRQISRDQKQGGRDLMCKTDKVVCFAIIYLRCAMHPKYKSGLVSYPLIPRERTGKESPRTSYPIMEKLWGLAKAGGDPGILL